MDIMGVAPSIWFPVVSVVIGFLCKGILDYFADTRRAKSEAISRRESRVDAALLRNIEFQRATLIEAQEALEKLARYAAKGNVEDERAHRATGEWGKNTWAEGLSEELRAAQSRVMLLESRIEDQSVREGLRGFRAGVTRIVLAKDIQQANDAMNHLANLIAPLHMKLGATLRQLGAQELNLLK